MITVQEITSIKQLPEGHKHFHFVALQQLKDQTPKANPSA